jgi:large subunit ribosomal protein L5
LSEDEIRKVWAEHPMRKPRIDKVIINISVGKSGEPLEKATKILQELTNHTPSKRKAKTSIRDFGIRKGEPIACIVTLRKHEAMDFLKKALPVVDNKLSKKCFDKRGNFAFGIKEHIELPGVKYDPETGIFGMDVCASINRRGYRVKDRRRSKTKIGSKHILSPEESIVFIKDTLGTEIA